MIDELSCTWGEYSTLYGAAICNDSVLSELDNTGETLTPKPGGGQNAVGDTRTHLLVITGVLLKLPVLNQDTNIQVLPLFVCLPQGGD